MLRKQEKDKQIGYEIVLLDELVAKDHLLRKVEAAVDFSFIHELCKPLYCEDNGRPAIEPELLFRMLLIGYLYGIKSEVKLAEAVNENIAFKWFLGLRLAQKGPDHATISINRVRRFKDNNIAEKIFDEILRQCVKRGLVGGQILYTDSTHIKAKANKHRKVLVTVEETPKEYIEELNAQVDLDREVLGKKPFERDEHNEHDEHDEHDEHNEQDEHGGGNSDDSPSDGRKDGGKTVMKSLTDPDAGQQTREGKPDGFHYSEHRTVDSKNNVIVNVHVEPANVNDMTPVAKILEEIKRRLGHLPRYMGFDAGYHSAAIAHLMIKEKIQAVIGYRRHTHAGEHYGKYRFRYDPENDVYICPEKHHRYGRTTTLQGDRQDFCDSKKGQAGPRRQECFWKSGTRRMVDRHVWQDDLDAITAFTKTANGRRLYSWRKETIERSFAEAKENHGLRLARMLGLQNMREQCFLTAAAQNIKRLVNAW